MEINRAGRFFPEPLNTPAQNKSNRIRKLQTNPTEDSIPDRIASAISERLTWNRNKNGRVLNTDVLAAEYVESLKQLKTFRDEVQQVFQEACRANLEFRQESGETHVEARDAVLSKRLSEMMSEASQDWTPPENIASAELFSLPIDRCQQRIDESLSIEVSKFGRQLLEQLAKLVDKKLCGLVEWLPNNCCRYHFFRRVVLQGDAVRSSDIDFLTDDESPNSIRRTTNKVSVQHQIRHARHEHELINTVRTSIGNSTVVMPPQIVRLVENIPEWLYPFVEVIDGQIIRERIIERDISVEDWTQVQVRDEPVIGPDPGIIIGPYVLSGWGTREIERELKRRGETEKGKEIQLVSSQVWRYAAASFYVCVFALWLLYQHMQGRAGIQFAGFATLLAIFLVWKTTLNRAISAGIVAVRMNAVFLTISVIAALLLSEWLVIRQFYTLSWTIPLALGTTAFISYQVGRLIR